MGRTVLLVGIGPGNPEQVTIQAIKAMNRTDVFFIPDKGEGKHGLADARKDVIDRYVEKGEHRIASYAMPERGSPADSSGYGAVVSDWHGSIERIYDTLLNDELNEGECGAFLIWGDPSLYDSVLRILNEMAAEEGAKFDLEVIPGVTSIQALAASHGVPLNTVGQSVLVTTGRRYSEGSTDDPDTVVVMLDGQHAYRKADEDLEIYWGAYVGTPKEILVSGRLGDVADEISSRRAQAREENGWIMDIYLLRRPIGL